MTTKNKGGRPPKLTPDAKTLGTIETCGRFYATVEEIAGALNVSKSTMSRFFDAHPEALEARERGEALGSISLRRAQMKAAVEKLNPTMLIWMGKQHLGQTDKVDQRSKGEITIVIDADDARV
jgi:hypothetical protein